jgi:hypothetical protein
MLCLFILFGRVFALLEVDSPVWSCWISFPEYECWYFGDDPDMRTVDETVEIGIGLLSYLTILMCE